MAKFSLIMAAYNAEKYIKAAIESVLQQTYNDWELIIVNDGSVDDTADIIDAFKNTDSRIVVIHQNNSGTASAARNTALEYVTGDFVQLFDSDDLISEDFLESFNRKISIVDCDIIIPNCLCFENDDINSKFWEKKAPNGDYDSVIGGERAFYLSLDWTIHGIFMAKTDLIKRIRYDPGLINGDEFTTRKLLYNAKNIGFVDSYYYYRRNTSSTTLSYKNQARMYETLITDMNIYKFAIDNNMSEDTVGKCSNLLVRSFCGHARDIYCLDDEQGKDKAKSILSDVFSFITTKMWLKAPFKYKVFYMLGFGNYELFMREMRLLSEAWELFR